MYAIRSYYGLHGRDGRIGARRADAVGLEQRAGAVFVAGRKIRNPDASTEFCVDLRNRLGDEMRRQWISGRGSYNFV